MNCPKCGLLLSPGVQKCVCGFEVSASSETKASLDTPATKQAVKSAKSKASTKVDWACTVLGMLIGLGVIPICMYGGRFGQILLGALGMGGMGILGMGFLPYAGSQSADGKVGCGAELAFLTGALGCIGGILVGGIMGAMGQSFDWWIWPLAALAGMTICGVTGSLIYNWLRRS